ncbi:hypothetical protein FRC01_003042 [Tulasnella sp. 417]|nr:hypothetical protein FRC01_003042 [Tulasnella sp. 417]
MIRIQPSPTPLGPSTANLDNGLRSTPPHRTQTAQPSTVGTPSTPTRSTEVGRSLAFQLMVDIEIWNAGTWHEGYGSVAISYTFNGTGIAVYFISSDQSDTPANTSFFIDGQLSQTVGGAPNGIASPLSYTMQVFAVSNLQDQSHELFISQSGSSSAALILDYLTYEESVADPAYSDDLTTPTSAAAQAATEPVDPLRVPASHGTERSAAGGAVAGALIGTLLLVVAVGVFLKLRNRRRPALLPLNYDVGDEAQPEVVASSRPPSLNISYSGEPQRKHHHIASHYNESTTDEKSDESSVAQPSQNDRRSRFRSAVSTVVGALSPCQITSQPATARDSAQYTRGYTRRGAQLYPLGGSGDQSTSFA